MATSPEQPLSRREREILDIVYARGRATAHEVLAALPDPPGYSAVRGLLRVLVEKHLLYTGSARARAILEDWDNAVRRFVKVLPVDFKRALMELKAERAAARAVAAE